MSARCPPWVATYRVTPWGRAQAAWWLRGQERANQSILSWWSRCAPCRALTQAAEATAPASAALRERTLLSALAGLIAVARCPCNGDAHSGFVVVENAWRCPDCAMALRNARDLVAAGAGAQGGH